MKKQIGFLLFSLLLAAQESAAISIHALYTASCQRQVGIIVSVNDRQVHLLTLSGHVVAVDRFEVIYHSTYPLDTIPVKEVLDSGRAPRYRISTYQGGALRHLVTGWAVDFSQDKVSLLSMSGSEIVIDRTSIWQIEPDQSVQRPTFERTNPTQTEFVHPYAFSSCPTGNPGATNKVFPQQLLSDPITIKRDFDRLAEGHKGLRRYVVAQVFYPVPEVYSNYTSLGIWLMSDSRYGASSNRKNNFTPLLVDEKSTGPFSFQSRFVTGSGPMLQSIHEETQTQAYYRFKADYFHMSLMMDPNLLLVGSKYPWQSNDLNGSDIRAVENTMVEIGFDFGAWAIEGYAGSAINVAAQHAGFFEKDTLNLGRVGLRYQAPRWMFNVMGGGASDGGFEMSLFRANFEWQPNTRWRGILTVIQRNLKYSGLGSLDLEDFVVESKSSTVAGYLFGRFRSRYWAGGLVSLERHSLSSGLASADGKDDKVFPKVGAMISLTF